MRPQDLPLELLGDATLSQTERVRRTLEAAIRKGRFAPGDPVPGSRVLAEILGVNRKTVTAALQELEAQGWLLTEPNRGSFVSPERFAPAAPRKPVAQAAAFDLPSRLSPLSAADPHSLLLADGLPDAALFPVLKLAEAYQRALSRHGGRLLQQGEAPGEGLLRTVLAEWLRERRGLVLQPEQILVTRGSRSAVGLLAQALLREGDAVAVEDPGQHAAWEAIRQVPGARLLPVPVDEEGLDVDALAELLQRERVRLLLVSPRNQFPTNAVLGPARRAALLALAGRFRLALLEHDHDAGFAYGNAPRLPLAHQDADGHVVYLGSLSRLIAPGLGLSFLAGPLALMTRLARLQKQQELQAEGALEWALADLIRDGLLDKHLRKAREAYKARRGRLVELLEARFAEQLELRPPEEGLALWLRARPGVDLGRWVACAKAEGVVLDPPERFCLASAGAGTRMGFAQVEEPALEEAVRRLERAWKQLRRS